MPELEADNQAANQIVQPGASAVAAVILRAPTVIGDDPYDSIRPELKAIPVDAAGGSGNVLKAKRASVLRMGTGSATVKLKPPDPIVFPELD